MRGILNAIIMKRRADAAIQTCDVHEMCLILPDADARTQARILKALGGIRDSDSGFSALIKYLHAPDARLREIAAMSLGTLKNARAAAHLAHQLKIEANGRVINAINRAMEGLKHD